METQTTAPASPKERTARTPFGKKLLEARRSIIASDRPLLDWDNIDWEIAEQRGRWGREEEH